MPINACRHYILHNLYEIIPLQNLAEATGLSPVYLSTIFKQEVGCTITKYIQKERLVESKKLLHSKQITLYQK